MLELIRFFRREIRCSFLPLPDIISQSPQSLPLVSAFDTQEPFDLVLSYEKAKESSFEEMFFTKEDWASVDALFRSLGKGDGAEQTEYLNFCEDYFLRAEAESAEALGKKGKPAVVLGCAAGTMLILLLM